MKIEIEDFLDWIQKELNTSHPPELQTVFREIPTWSSLNALVIMTQAFEKWNVLLTAQQLAASTTLGDILEQLNSK